MLFNNGFLDLNKVIVFLLKKGYDQNSEIYRKLYRDLGYSLSGYFDVFYWDMNNPDCDLYRKEEIKK